jgi:ABC-type antimicrobial peptide transport system permease subunit
MIRSYVKIFWRTLLKRKVNGYLNILGLSSGITAAILIGLWITDEITFNYNFENHDRLAEVMVNQTIKGWTSTSPTVSPAIAEPLSTEYAANFTALSLVSWPSARILAVGEQKVSGVGRWVQHKFPEMFTLDMVAGSRGALQDPSTAMISVSLAKSLFGDDNPINQSLRINNDTDFRIGGVYKDLPTNSSFGDTHFLLSWDNPQNWMRSVTAWDNHSCLLFVQLVPQVVTSDVAATIRQLPTPYVDGWLEELTLQPLDDVHLYNEFINGKAAGGRVQYVWLFGVIGVFVLMLACINFMNLSTARSAQRAKEVGIRKTTGSTRKQLIAQFLMESITLVCLAFAVALAAVEMLLPFFNTIADKQLNVPWLSPIFWLWVSGVALFTGVLSGSYPAFYLSAFKPANILKNNLAAGPAAATSRKLLVVLQFTVSITLIIGTLFIYRQIQFAKSRPAGFDRSGLVTVWMSTPDLQQHYDALRADLLQSGAVVDVAVSSQSPAFFGNNTSIVWPGKDPAAEVFFRNVTVSADFGNTVAWTVVAGRDFSGDRPSDSTGIIINERAAAIMDLDEPLGEKVWWGDEEFEIIGVVNDMITQSPYAPPEPTFFSLKGWYGVITIRLNPARFANDALAAIEPIFKKYNPTSPFAYGFVDQEFGRKFSSEERVGKLSTLFAALAIAISCLGIFGLAAFSAEQRTKEIGIRKVLGASAVQLWRLLSKDFLILVLISCCIAIPLAAYVVSSWLQSYAYRTPLSWHIFVVAGISALLITMLTISYQTLKAALKNPVKNLRTD